MIHKRMKNFFKKYGDSLLRFLLRWDILTNDMKTDHSYTNGLFNPTLLLFPKEAP